VGRGRDAVERLLRIAPQGGNQSHIVARSSIALVKEYLRRVAEWAELSGQAADLDTRDVLRVDLAGLLLPELLPAPVLMAALSAFQLHGGIATRVAANYVRWEAAAGHVALVETGMWEPYEPLVRLFERGGELFTHHGFIHVEHSACFMPGELHSFASLPPLLDLHPRALDKLDRAE
jgi:hypothetical protein